MLFRRFISKSPYLQWSKTGVKILISAFKQRQAVDGRDKDTTG